MKFQVTANKKCSAPDSYLLIYVVFFIINLLIQLPAYSQNPAYKHYTIDDGLPSNEVYHIMQDKQGYIWVSTSKGAARFDGNRFEIFTIANGLPDNEILKVVEDKAGRLWFISFTGPLTYYADGFIHNSSNTPFLKNLELKSTVVAFTPLNNGDIIFSSKWYSATILRDTMLLPFDFKDYISVFEKKDSPFALLGGKKSDMDRSDMKFYPEMKDTITVTDSGNYYFRNHKKYLIDNSRFNLIWNRFLLKLDNEAYYWFFGKNGLHRFKLDNEGNVISNQNYFEGLIIDDIFQDKDFNFWLATKGDGLLMIPSLHTRLFNKSSGLSDNNVTTAIKSSDGKIICGTLNGAAYTIDKNRIIDAIDFHSNGIRKIMSDNMSNIYYLCDLNLFKNKISLNKHTNSNLRYKSMTLDNNNELLVGGISKLFRYSVTKTNTITLKNSALRFYSVFQNNQNEIWMGTEHGVYRLVGSQNHNILLGDSLIPFHHELKPFNGWIDDINISMDGRILITTRDSGLAFISNEKIEFIGTKGGLQSNACSSLYSDTLTGKIYIGTDKGLSIIEFNGKNKPEIKNYNTTNGLLCGSIYSVFEKDGEILLSTNKGLLVFDEKNLNTTIESPKVFINDLLINSKNVPLKKEYKLSHDNNNIRIIYNGISFRDAKSLEFRYQLIPADTGWNTTFSNTVVYPDLSPGSYKFIVQVRTGNGSWSNENSSINFEIDKPYWRTLWFIVSVILILIISLIVLFRYRINQNNKQFGIEKELLQTELKALRAQINPHFIFNSLNSIQDFILKNEMEDANKYLTKFAKLIRMILNNSSKKYIPLAEEVEFLKLYLELENVRFSKQFSFVINIDDDINQNETYLPPMILQLYLENAIIHGLAQKVDGGKLILDFYMKNNSLICGIKDNGIGRNASAELKNYYTKESHEPVGMQNTNDRIEAINKTETKQITYIINDLQDENGKGIGTEIILSFPQ